MRDPPAFRDRLGYGGVMLLFGVPIGGIIGLLGSAVSQPPHFNLVAAIITAIVFFSIGLAFLDRGVDFIAVCLHSVVLCFWTAISFVGGSGAPYEFERRDFSPTWCLFALLAWVVLVVVALLKF